MATLITMYATAEAAGAVFETRAGAACINCRSDSTEVERGGWKD